MMKSKDAAKILMECLAKASAAPAERPSGCGRVYIVPTRESRSDLRRACKALGKRWLSAAWGVGVPCMYYGYDNASGHELARGRKLAETLSEHGIECFMDAVGD